MELKVGAVYGNDPTSRRNKRPRRTCSGNGGFKGVEGLQGSVAMLVGRGGLGRLDELIARLRGGKGER